MPTSPRSRSSSSISSWFVVSLPIVTLIPATAALFYATNRLAHERPASPSTFFEGLRKWFWRSCLWGGLNLLVIAVLVSNLIFYSRIQAVWTALATALVVFLLIVWLLLQISMFPLLLEQEQPSLRLAFRNSFVVLLKRPLATLRYAAADRADRRRARPSSFNRRGCSSAPAFAPTSPTAPPSTPSTP